MAILTLLTASVCPADDSAWARISREEVDTRLLSPRGMQLLDDEQFKWDHARTDHFEIHFERKRFAQKVGRMAKFFYHFISEDLGAPEDRTAGPSHIFIFRRERDWEHFVENYNVSMEWAFSLVSGYTMFLQEADDRTSSGQILAHEMSHLVFNRFYRASLPLWLNEGMAEWYGTFAYDAFRHTRRQKKHVFRGVDEIYPIEGLLNARSYPADRDAVASFYETSKYLVGYLQLRYPEEAFVPFLEDIVRGMDARRALKKHYEVTSLAEFSRDFERFSN